MGRGERAAARVGTLTTGHPRLGYGQAGGGEVDAGCEDQDSFEGTQQINPLIVARRSLNESSSRLR